MVRWDDDDEMATVMLLSHLVQATEMGMEFTARIETDEKGRLIEVEQSDVLPVYARAYCPNAARRRWITQADAEVLKELVAARKALLPSLADTRLGLALSTFADGPFVHQARPRALLAVTTLEGLVSTIPERALKQFVTRAPALAAEVGLENRDAAWAKAVYSLRSKLAHGSSVLQSSDDAQDEAQRELQRRAKVDEFQAALTEVEALLRALLRKALLDATFRDRLANVDQHWPVAAKGCPACKVQDEDLLDVTCPRCSKPWVASPLAKPTAGS